MRSRLALRAAAAIGLAISIAAAHARQQDASQASGESKESNESKVLVIKAKRILPVSGDAIDGGLLIIRDGRIEALGSDLAAPDGAEIIELPDGVVTPGLIDAHTAINSEMTQARTFRPRRGRRAPEEERGLWRQLGEAAKREHVEAIERGDHVDHAEHADGDPVCGICSTDDPAARVAHCPQRRLHELTAATGCPVCGYPQQTESLDVGLDPGATWGEHAMEIQPHLSVIDTVNLLSNDFDRLLREGVTTVWVSPDSSGVICMRGAIVKTGGPLDKRVVRDADAVKAVMGRDAIMRGAFNRPPRGDNVTLYSRRPTTRMGVDWVFRKAFYDAMRASEGLAIHGADMPPPEAVPVLMDVITGRVPLRMQARQQNDIMSAIRLADEFGLGRGDSPWPFILEEATEAYKCIPALKAHNIPVVYGPIYMTAQGFRVRTGETDGARLNGAKQLLDAGLTVALTANDMRGEDGLARQAMVAVRYGLSPAEALKAVTETPAKLLNLGDSIGTLSKGAAADLVVWNADPMTGPARAELVIIGGEVVYRDK